MKQYGTMQQVKRAISEWLAFSEYDIDTDWYMASQWRERGEEYCNDADFVFVYDNSLSFALNCDFNAGVEEELFDLAEGFGYYIEYGTHWYAGFYKIENFDPLPRKDATYDESRADTRWKNKRKKIVARANKRCENCSLQKPLQVHHCYYRYPRYPWQYPNDSLLALCSDCHEKRGPLELKVRASLPGLKNADLTILVSVLRDQGSHKEFLLEALRVWYDRPKATALFQKYLDGVERDQR